MYYFFVVFVVFECVLNVGFYVGRFYFEGIICILNYKNIYLKVVSFYLIVFFIKIDFNYR